MGVAGSKAEPDPDCVGSKSTTNYEGLDFYEILCISKVATDEEVKKAYYMRAKQIHPDKDSTPGAKERFQKLNEAYETLKNTQRRAAYDIDLENKLKFESENGTAPDSPPFSTSSSVPGQWDNQSTQTHAGSQGWFEWFFSSYMKPSDPFLRFVPETYIAQNRHLARPRGISATEIHEYLSHCMEKATWEENGRDPSLYTVLGNLFKCIAYDEKRWGYHIPIPDFGYMHSGWCADDGYAPHYTKDFYVFWLNFESRKSFDWVNPYYTDLNDPALLRKIEIENKNVHQRAKEQYNNVIRTIVELLLPGDPRVLEHLIRSCFRSGVLTTMEEFRLRFLKECRPKSNGPREPAQNNHEQHRTQTRNQRKKQKQRNKEKKKNSW